MDNKSEGESSEKLDLDQFDNVTKGSKTKALAHRAFKKHKAGLEVSDYEKDLIAMYYPWLCEE
jgi:hypothetical protein